MAYGILILLFSALTFAADTDTPAYNMDDPNLKERPDGAMNYDTENPLNKIDTTSGALIFSDKIVPMRPAKNDTKKPSR